MTASPVSPRPPVITSAELALKLVAKLDQAMNELLALLQEETRLIKAGHLKAAGVLQEEKNEKATLYTRLMLVARDEIEVLKLYAPEETRALIKRHELFRSEVQINLAVLDTAKDVAEGLMRTVADEVGRSERPSTYGRPGTPTTTSTAARGIAINRNC